ncbi:MAG: hypothetical protein ACE5HD_02375 [Acidobacteriota bacterium]
MADRVLQQGEAVYHALRRMVGDLLALKGGGTGLTGCLRELELPLVLPLERGQAVPELFSRRLRTAIEAHIDTAIRQAAPTIHPGHVYCHHCDAAACQHSWPPTSRHVFAGYNPVGTPVWMPFAQFCLENRHPKVHHLHRVPPAVLTLVQNAGPLRARLLPAWRSRSRKLLGQLTAGYFTLRGCGAPGREVVALTIQVVAWSSGGKRSSLELSLLGRGPDGQPLDRLAEEYEDLPWCRPVLWARAALRSVPASRMPPGRRRMTGRGQAVQEQQVARILAGLARRLQRGQRGRTRRTSHAEQRHRSGRRPTRKALDDARTARFTAYLVDERSRALVILGERGRTHFFTPQGRLVSSVRYSREAIARKMKLGRWRAASRAEAGALQQALLRSEPESGPAMAGPA